jgi:hypothetical protein
MPQALHPENLAKLTAQIKPFSTGWALTSRIDGHIGRFLGPIMKIFRTAACGLTGIFCVGFPA